MKNWKKIALGISGLALMSASLFTVSMAWYQSLNKATIGNQDGYTASAYFAGGNGSEATPYIINQPIHLYNLAWLQYLGFFNKTENGAYKQTYFVLGSNVDMSSSTINWTLPPIGTSDNPFIGNFDGKGYTISNLVVDNAIGDGHITRKPSVVSSITGVNIVGTFGVVGPYGSFDTTTYTYSSAVNTVKNVYLDNAEVKSQLDQTLIGVAAGYVNTTISNIGLIDSKITIGSTSALASGPTSNISDYSTIGYCTEPFRKTRSLVTTLIRAPQLTTSEFTYEGTGDGAGWGGSVAMKTMYNRLLYFHQNPTKIVNLNTYVISVITPISSDGSSLTPTTTYYSTATDESESYREYFNDAHPLYGRYCFGRQFNNGSEMTTYLYLNGYRLFPKTTANSRANGTIHSGSNYLIPNGTTGVKNTTNATTGQAWMFSNLGTTESATTTIYTIINGTIYYLNGSSSGLSLSTTSQTWEVSYSASSGYNFYFYSNGYYYNINYSNSRGWYLYRTSNYVYVSATPSTLTNVVVDNEINEPTYDTYFPLNTYGTNDKGYDPYDPKLSNTGYVVSSSETATGIGYNYGNIRVSQYDMGNLYRSLNGSNSWWSGLTASYADNKLEVVTRTKTSAGSYVRISDDYNSGNTNTNNTVQSEMVSTFPTKTPVSTLGLQKYTASRKELSKTLTGQTNVYGLHFLNAQISASDYATATLARIKGIDRAGYQMPRNSIDFNLTEKGYINFFAGTYYSSNNTFFSLHQIFRNDNLTLASTKEISKVYSDGVTSHPFVYYYTDGTYSNPSGTGFLQALPTDYGDVTSPLFDMTWVTNPTMLEYAMYYFEIPVNPGEYALGSVNGTGKYGAYLIYLDISANAQEINRTTIIEDIVTQTDVFVYPDGIAIVMTATETVDPLTGAAFALLPGYSGSFSFAKSTNTITLTSPSSTSFSAGFKGDSIALAKAGSTDPPVLVPFSSTTDEIKRLTYIDFNLATESSSTTIITDHGGSKTCTDENGTLKTQYVDGTSGKLVDFGTGSAITINSLSSPSILTYSYYSSSASNTITFTFVLTHERDSSVTTLHVDKVDGYTITSITTSEGLSITVAVYDGTYTITINGTTVATGTIISVPVTSA